MTGGRMLRAGTWAAGATAAAVCAAYAVVLSAPVIYDDFFFVQGNPLYGLGLIELLGKVLSADYLTASNERTFQPLVTLLHYPVSQSPPVYRAAGLLIHATNGWLVYLLGRRLKLSEGAALAAGLLFCLFPAHTEAVNISAFKGHPLAFTFSLLTLAAWIGAESRPRVLAAHAAFALALLSKETGVLALPLVWLHGVCFERRRPAEVLKRSAGLIVLAAAYLVFRFAVLSRPPSPEGMIAWTPLLSLRIVGWYLGFLVIPHPLCLAHALGPWDGWDAVRLLLLPAFCGLLVVWRRDPLRLFALAWLALAMTPYLRILPLATDSWVTDRYLYSLCAPFCLLLASLLYETRARVLLAVLALAWGGRTVLRNGTYRDVRALYEQTAACAPEHSTGHALLGAHLYAETGEHRAALESFERAFALDPGLRVPFEDPGLVHTQGAGYVLGLLRHRLGEHAEGEKLLSAALSAEKGSVCRAAILEKLGDARLAQGKRDEAFESYGKARAELPRWFMPYMKQGAALLGDDPGSALKWLERAGKRAGEGRPPASRVGADLEFLTGRAAAAAGDESRAVRAWEASLALDPGRFEVLILLARLHAGAGRLEAARAVYDRAVEGVDRGLRGLPKSGEGGILSDLLRQRRELILRERDRLATAGP